MKKSITKRTRISILFAILVVGCSAPAVYAGSAVSMIDDEVISALEGFRFGQPVAQANAAQQQNADQVVLDDCSMINEEVIAGLKDFRFGSSNQYLYAQKKNSPVEATSWSEKSDSIIDAELISQLEGVEIVEGVRIVEAKFVADMRAIMDKFAEN